MACICDAGSLAPSQTHRAGVAGAGELGRLHFEAGAGGEFDLTRDHGRPRQRLL